MYTILNRFNIKGNNVFSLILYSIFFLCWSRIRNASINNNYSLQIYITQITAHCTTTTSPTGIVYEYRYPSGIAATDELMSDILSSIDELYKN